MATQYPNRIDDNTTLPLVFDDITEVTADTVNRLRSAIIAIEQALGIQPADGYALLGGVSARLDNIDTQIVDLNASESTLITEVTNLIAALNGEQIELGTPTGGFLTGITTIQSTSLITEVLNTFNNIMSFLAPAQPQSMSGLAIDTLTSIPVFTGKIATLTSPPAGYYGPFTAGSVSNRITKTQSFTLTTHNTGDSTTGFSDADKGILVLLINGTQVTTFNLGIAFNEAHRADPAGQGVTYDGGLGSATPPLLIIDAHTEIFSIALFNGFPLWQKGVALITNSALTGGYNSFQFKHTVGAVDRLSQTFQLFYDNSVSTPSYASTPGLSISGTPGSFNFLSGIKFLTTSATLQLTTTINNAFTNTYLQAPLGIAFTVGIPSATIDLSDSSVTVPPSNNPAAPNTTDQFVMTKTFPISVVNQQTINERANLTYTNVFGSTFPASSASQNMLVNTYNSPASTATADSFVDENRRLVPDISGATMGAAAYPNDYVTIPGTLTGQWDSTAILVNGNAQVYNAQLLYPTINFTSGYLPAQNGSANYSGFNNSNPHSGQVYYRAMFSSGNPRSNGTLTVGGITLADLTGSPHVKLEMKLPTQTGWLDFSLPFDSGTFTGATGQGCRTSNSGGTFGWSVGTFTTGSSGFMYILRITLFDTTRTITSLSEAFA